MALTVTASSSTPHNEESSTCWSLHGHSAEILCIASHRQRVCVSGDADGVMLAWRFPATSSPEHVCRMRTGGPAVVDVAWASPSTLLAAQGDGCATLWNVETGSKTRSLSRYAVKGRCAWPVVNCVTSTMRDAFVYGGDDGYLVSADTRSDTVGASVPLNVPITAVVSTDYSLFVGDVCGTLHWFDTRVGTKELERIPCGRAGITSVIAPPQRERLVVYTLSGDAHMVDSQPFALSSSDRLLGSTNLGENTRQALLRGAWVESGEAVVLPSGDGDGVAVAAADVAGGVVRTVHTHQASCPMNVCAAVDKGSVLCGGGTELALYTW